MVLQVLVVDIYERAIGGAYPVVRHEFRGRTKKEAEGYLASHMQTDEFLRNCVSHGRWDGVECWADRYWSTDEEP